MVLILQFAPISKVSGYYTQCMRLRDLK